MLSLWKRLYPGLVWLTCWEPVHCSTFKPDCTLPSNSTNYVSGPNTRGTMSILWNCLSIIFLCTWSIQHLNVPAMRPQTNSTRQKIWWAILDSRTKIKWMIFTILVPEYIVGKALNEMVAVNTRISRGPGFGGDRWDKVTMYMANMGYFIVDFRDYWLKNSTCEEGRTVEDDAVYLDRRKFTTSPAAGGYSLQKVVQASLQDNRLAASTRLNISRLSHPYWALTSDQLDYLIPEILDSPAVSVRQLEVLNRGDPLVKTLALVQIVYLVTQLIARRVGGLPSAQLEIAALAFSVSSFITYVLYWNRPQGIESVHVMKPKCAPSKARIVRMARQGPAFLWTNYRPKSDFKRIYDVEPIPNDGMLFIALSATSFGHNIELVVLAGGAFLGGTIFGAIHCLAWNFHFPTHAETLAWRVCSVMTSALPLLSALPLGFWMRWHPWSEQPKKSPAMRFALSLTLILGFAVPYVLARLLLIVEMFRTLFFLPPEAFVDTWSGSFPHLG
ncbi:hypothetical protein N431DRAFT_469014 [Stipitochalara longipes BDJ]|nr:hypothetical protein N431DRAFT_469014 [Stipitochalara longipes BDJ]